MNRFNGFFGHFNNYDNITVKGGSFVLRHGKKEDLRGDKRFLYAVKENNTEECFLNANIRRIAPFGDNGIACQTYYPLGDRRIILYFFIGEGIKTEDGYIISDNKLVYTYRESLRISREPNGSYDCIFNNEQLKHRGYEGKLFFNDECFGIPSCSKELVPFLYYNYDGSLNEEYKELKIAREIMNRIGSFISVGFDDELDEEATEEINSLTWEAKSATADDVLRLISATKKCNMLDKEASKKMAFIIKTLSQKGLKDYFTRFMELLFAALNRSSGQKEWIKINILKNKSEKEMREILERYTKINSCFEKNMCEIAALLINSPDFNYLLFDNGAFEAAFERIINEKL
ncbi:MAG: hypothetical protein IJ946_01670 [Clostridia bacterium]|nr:hypothetical protein [Clostridia bacterium]